MSTIDNLIKQKQALEGPKREEFIKKHAIAVMRDFGRQNKIKNERFWKALKAKNHKKAYQFLLLMLKDPFPYQEIYKLQYLIWDIKHEPPYKEGLSPLILTTRPAKNIERVMTYWGDERALHYIVRMVKFEPFFEVFPHIEEIAKERRWDIIYEKQKKRFVFEKPGYPYIFLRKRKLAGKELLIFELWERYFDLEQGKEKLKEYNEMVSKFHEILELDWTIRM